MPPILPVDDAIVDATLQFAPEVVADIREGWPMAPEHRAAAIDHLETVVADPQTRPQLLSIARNAWAAGRSDYSRAQCSLADRAAN